MVNPKFDPMLSQLLEQAADGSQQVQVMLALDQPPQPEVLAALAAGGFHLRGQVGDILTGTLRIDALEAVAAEPSVRVIEGSRLLSPETPPGG